MKEKLRNKTKSIKLLIISFICLILSGCNINRYECMYYAGDDNSAYEDDSIRIISNKEYWIIFNPVEKCNGLDAILFFDKNVEYNVLYINKLTLKFEKLNFQVSKDCLIETQFSEDSNLCAAILTDQISCNLITKAYNEKFGTNLSDYDIYKKMKKELKIILNVEGYYDIENERKSFQRNIFYTAKHSTTLQFIDTLLNQ